MAFTDLRRFSHGFYGFMQLVIVDLSGGIRGVEEKFPMMMEEIRNHPMIRIAYHRVINQVDYGIGGQDRNFLYSTGVTFRN